MSFSKTKPSLRRINLYGGPGISKSTNAAGIFHNLKKVSVAASGDLKIELVREFVKEWAYLKRKPEGFAQNYIFAQQQHLEEIPLLNGVDVIVTDSPLLLSAAYAKRSNVSSWQSLAAMAALHETAYPGLHIMLERGDRPYVAHGRYEDKEKALFMDVFIKEMLDTHLGSTNYVTLPYDNFDAIYSCVTEKLGI